MINTIAMLGSGTTGNLIDIDFAKQNDIPLSSCVSPLSVAAYVHHVTQDLILQIGALHTEIIHLYLIPFPNYAIILILPWLQHHNPQISWADREIAYWSQSCQTKCLQSVTALHINTVEVKHEDSRF